MTRIIFSIIGLMLFAMWCGNGEIAKSHAKDIQSRNQISLPYDNYPNVESASYAKARDDFLRASVITYFAAGCRVFLKPENLQQVSAMLILAHEYERLQRNPLWAADRTINRESQEADLAGLELAAHTPGCAYWRENQQAVAAMRLAEEITGP